MKYEIMAIIPNIKLGVISKNKKVFCSFKEKTEY